MRPEPALAGGALAAEERHNPQWRKILSITSACGELRQKIETISMSMLFPSMATGFSIMVLARRTSRHAAHSRADPRAMSKNRQGSADLYYVFDAFLGSASYRSGIQKHISGFDTGSHSDSMTLETCRSGVSAEVGDPHMQW